MSLFLKKCLKFFRTPKTFFADSRYPFFYKLGSLLYGKHLKLSCVQKIAPYIRNEKDILNGNRIIIIHNDGTEKEVNVIKNLTIIHYGKNSLIKIHESSIFRMPSKIELSERAFVYIKKNTVIDATNIIIGRNNTLMIHDNCIIMRSTIHVNNEPNIEVIIGKDCLFAANTTILASDGHAIFDTNNKIINKPYFGVHIGNHVWICRNVTITKDVIIPNNCIIGISSLVNKANSFEENCIIAGIPARVIKKNITWDKKHCFQFENK